MKTVENKGRRYATFEAVGKYEEFDWEDNRYLKLGMDKHTNALWNNPHRQGTAGHCGIHS